MNRPAFEITDQIVREAKGRRKAVREAGFVSKGFKKFKSPVPHVAAPILYLFDSLEQRIALVKAAKARSISNLNEHFKKSDNQ